MERKYKSKLVGLAGLALVASLTLGCASSKPYHFEPIGETSSGEITYKKVPEESKENYKAGPGTSCLGNALIFMLHLGGL